LLYIGTLSIISQGASLEITHSTFSSVNNNLSCKRLGRPCQNSIETGLIRYPPNVEAWEPHLQIFADNIETVNNLVEKRR